MSINALLAATANDPTRDQRSAVAEGATILLLLGIGLVLLCAIYLVLSLQRRRERQRMSANPGRRENATDPWSESANRLGGDRTSNDAT